MKRQLVLVIVAALVVLGGFTVAAALVPSGCPSGWHRLESGGCLTDATHVAPSSGRPIPIAVMEQAPQRWGLRARVVLVGVLLAGGIVWVGLKGRPSLQGPP